MKKCMLMLVACYCPIVMQAQVITARIGYVDIPYIVTRLPETKATDAELAALQQQYRKRLDAKVKEFVNGLETIRGHSYDRMSDSTRHVVEQDLYRMQQEIETTQQEIQAALEQRQAALTTAVLEKIRQAVDVVSRREGFNFMLCAEHVLYGDATFDITFPVLATLGVVLSEADKQQYLQARNTLDGWRSINK